MLTSISIIVVVVAVVVAVVVVVVVDVVVEINSIQFKYILSDKTRIILLITCDKYMVSDVSCNTYECIQLYIV